MNRDEILKAIENKYDTLGVPVDSMLEGLLWSTPITYWDYIQTDALLGLQIPRTSSIPHVEILIKQLFLTVPEVSRKIHLPSNKFLTTSFQNLLVNC